ncbi:MAG TPA: hypothetical protein VLT87_12850 [Thermoanaerobaculia bacterium]|nr:hypothetical protein [Thermoanaerobaculia bacterium]
MDQRDDLLRRTTEIALEFLEEIDVVIGDEAHATILSSLQMLGLGRGRVRKVPSDGQGRMRAALAR